MIDEQNKTILIVWSVEDVIERAEDYAEDYAEFYEEEYNRIALSENEAWKMLKEIYHNHDCNNGITWDTIDAYIYDYLRNQREEQ